MTRSRHTAGFTFLELTLVLVIIAVVAAAAAPMFSKAMPSLAVRNAARLLAAAAQRAHSEAAARAVRFKLTLDLSEQTLSITAETDPLSQPGRFVELPELWTSALRLPDRARMESVSLTDEDGQDEALAAGEVELLFLPDGQATDAEIKLVADNGAEQYVRVRGATGRSEIHSEPTR